MAAAAASALNINIGVLGHVDCGKTSLVRALSSCVSTASLDHSPQSRQRGITLDLGFSSFSCPTPAHFKQEFQRTVGRDCSEEIQFTLVDCPGHASLIKTVIGGAQIIDLMLLVVDVTKGIQTQTAECLVIGEILSDRMIVVLNKTDLLTGSKLTLDKVTKNLRKVFSKTKFGADLPMVAVCANPGGAELDPSASNPSSDVSQLFSCLQDALHLPGRFAREGAFLMAMDHCFGVKGHGTICTGTILQGAIAVGDTVELPFVGVQRKVKSLQMFRRPVSRAAQGDRVAVCVTNMDPSGVERGLVCAPGSVSTCEAAIARVHRIRFFKGSVRSGQKYHVTIGHKTVTASVEFFALPSAQQRLQYDSVLNGGGEGDGDGDEEREEFDWEQEYLHVNELATSAHQAQFVLLRFDRAVTAPADCVLIGSNLSVDVHTKECRLAFHGRLLQQISPDVVPRLRVYKPKKREGMVDRVVDSRCVIGKNMFPKEVDLSAFLGLHVLILPPDRVSSSAPLLATLDSSFGKTGKFKLALRSAIPDEWMSSSSQPPAAPAAAPSTQSQSRRKKKSGPSRGAGWRLEMRMKKYVFDRASKEDRKRIRQ